MKLRRREGRQLALTEQSEDSVRWETLPREVRREVIALIARLLRSEVGKNEEVADE